MDAAYLNLLPDCGKALVAEIEGLTQKSIVVSEDPQRTKPGCRVTHLRAEIFFPDINHIEPRQFLHEILHIHRNWVQDVPLLLPKDRTSQQLVNVYGGFDNQLEHLVIVPWQAQLGQSVTASWTARLTHEWNNKFWEQIVNDQDRRVNTLMSYLSVAIIANDPALTQLAKAELKTLKLLSDAENFHGKMSRVIGDKARMAAAFLRFTQIPRNEAYLCYLDAVRGEEKSAEVPLH